MATPGRNVIDLGLNPLVSVAFLMRQWEEGGVTAQQRGRTERLDVLGVDVQDVGEGLVARNFQMRELLAASTSGVNPIALVVDALDVAEQVEEMTFRKMALVAPRTRTSYYFSSRAS